MTLDDNRKLRQEIREVHAKIVAVDNQLVDLVKDLGIEPPERPLQPPGKPIDIAKGQIPPPAIPIVSKEKMPPQLGGKSEEEEQPPAPPSPGEERGEKKGEPEPGDEKGESKPGEKEGEPKPGEKKGKPGEKGEPSKDRIAAIARIISKQVKSAELKRLKEEGKLAPLIDDIQKTLEGVDLEGI